VTAPTGFTYETRRAGDVVIRHHGRIATVLRSRKAEAFLADVATSDPQEVMARLTGTHKHGNERTPRHHRPRV
jgi:hypothetical protein